MNYYLLGVVVGIVFALAVFFIIAYLHRKKHPETGKYDERQIIGRGKAFQTGFFTLLIAGALCNIWDFVSPLPGGSFLWNIGTLMLGVTVFAVTAIHFDAYVGFHDNPRQLLIAGGCFICSMTLFGLTNIHSERPWGHTLGIINFGVGLVWIIIVAALLLHRRNSQKEDE